MNLSPKNQNLVIKRLAAEAAVKELERVRPEIEHLAIATISQAVCITLHDKWDFSIDNINVFLLQVADQFDSVLKNYLTMEDIEQWCKESGIINML